VNRREAAGLIETLTDVDEFLRTPGTWALLEAFYRDRRGSSYPGCAASALIDEVSLTLWFAQRRAEAAAEAEAAAARKAARS